MVNLQGTERIGKPLFYIDILHIYSEVNTMLSKVSPERKYHTFRQ